MSGFLGFVKEVGIIGGNKSSHELVIVVAGRQINEGPLLFTLVYVLNFP